MKRLPCHWPDSRATGARPARLAAALASRPPSSGIAASSPAAVAFPMPGMEASVSARRDSPSSPASVRAIAASTARSCRSICSSRRRHCCPSSATRRPLRRFSAATRSRASASRATVRSPRSRSALPGGSVGRRSSAAPIRARTAASAASVFALRPIDCAKRRARSGFARASGRPASASASSKSLW